MEEVEEEVPGFLCYLFVRSSIHRLGFSESSSVGVREVEQRALHMDRLLYCSKYAALSLSHVVLVHFALSTIHYVKAKEAGTYWRFGLAV